MNGVATAPGAGTILNALATGQAPAFAIVVAPTATVELPAAANAVTGRFSAQPVPPPPLLDPCV